MFTQETRNYYNVNKEIARAPITDEQKLVQLYEQERNNMQNAYAKMTQAQE